MASPVSHSRTVARSAGRAAAIRAAIGITSALAIDPAAAMRNSPAIESRDSSSAACASSSAARTGSVRWTSTRPASVSRTRPGPLQQRHSALSFERAQLLRDRRRGEAQRSRRCRDCPTQSHFAQDAEAANVQLHSVTLTSYLRIFNWT